MSDTWRRDHLPELVRSLATRPGHENTRVMVADILRNAFGAAYLAIDQEVRMPEVRGRADTLFGATILEFKSDLRREIDDVLSRLPDYLSVRERQTNRRFIGIATDGASFVAYERRNTALFEISRHTTDPAKPEALLAWLEPALSDRDDLAPEPLTI